MSAREVDVLIVGAGFSGLIMAMELRKRGFDDIAILEKADDIGGTWRENTYPGVACDVPAHLYSFASHLNPDWSTAYAGGNEIWAYMRDVAREEGLFDLCHFGRRFTSAAWRDGGWDVSTAEGDIWRARVLISGIGALHVPHVPEVPGFFSFPGPSFHSAEWEHDLDLTGRRVAVVGTGASAVQFVPEIAPVAGEVILFQRTAPYVLPRRDGPIRGWVRQIYRWLPVLARLRRWVNFNVFEFRHALFRGVPWVVNAAMKAWRKTLEKAIADPGLRAVCTPPYRIGCKRVLSSNAWYPTLARANVRVIPAGLASVSYRTLTATDGTEVDADVVIWATGFHVTDALAQIRITGPGGRSIHAAWADGLKAHLGTALAGFPNLFFLLGPHTGLGHNSVVLMIEAQAEHVGRVLEGMRAQGTRAVSPAGAEQDAFEAEMRDRLSGSVWQQGGCVSWYQDAEGRNPTLWPGTVREFQRRMARAGLEQYSADESG